MRSPLSVHCTSLTCTPQVSIERRIHPMTPLVIGDFSRMVQIMYNLLGNSLKFTQVCVTEQAVT